MVNEIFYDTVLKMKEQKRKALRERHLPNSQKICIFPSARTPIGRKNKTQGTCELVRKWCQITQHPPLGGQFRPIPEKQRPPLQIQYQLRKVLSQAAAELPFPLASHQRTTQAKSLRNSPPSIPGTLIFIYFKTNVRGESEL